MSSQTPDADKRVVPGKGERRVMVRTVAEAHGFPGFVLAKDGKTLAAHINPAGWNGPLPYQFDLDEYREFYGHVPDQIELEDIGYATVADGWQPASPIVRLTKLKALFKEAVEQLDNVSASLETVLLVCEKAGLVTTGDWVDRTIRCDQARQFLYKIGYHVPAEEDGDPDHG